MIKWQADDCADANGHITIREWDGSPNGDTGKQPIATVYDAGSALKIAAAPDLLEACKLAHALMIQPAGISAHVEVQEKLRAAIAKAEGGAA